jgi:hypothetical protein
MLAFGGYLMAAGEGARAIDQDPLVAR